MMCLCRETQNGAKTMGGDPHDPNDAEACLGNDVINQLNDVFGDPHSDKYQTAQANNQFGGVGTDYNLLIGAYGRVGLNVNGRWQAYLRKLHSIDPNNISTIATFRDNNLKSGAGMNTIIHLPEHGGHVRTQPGSGVDPAVINAPFPLPN
jgi:hypothetical protein